MKTDLEADIPPSAVDWRRLHALGLPAGSIRALLALLIFGTALGLLALRPTEEVPDYLRDLLFIIMGHYFASRHRAGMGVEEPGPSPLFLPRGSVRVLLIAGCLGVGVLLYSRGQLTTPGQHPGVVTLWLVGGFLLGVALNSLSRWVLGRDRRTPRFIEDTRAMVSIVAALVLVALVWNRFHVVVPPDQIDQAVAPLFHLGKFRLEHVLAAVVGFYFGSRS
jgi:hypothetical protein